MTSNEVKKKIKSLLPRLILIKHDKDGIRESHEFSYQMLRDVKFTEESVATEKIEWQFDFSDEHHRGGTIIKIYYGKPLEEMIVTGYVRISEYLQLLEKDWKVSRKEFNHSKQKIIDMSFHASRLDLDIVPI